MMIRPGIVSGVVVVANRQALSPVTITDPSGLSVNSPSLVQVADGSYYQHGFQDSSDREIIRLDFGASKFIQDVQLVTVFGSNFDGSVTASRNFRLFGSNGGSLTGLTSVINPTGASASSAIADVNASYRYLHLYSQMNDANDGYSYVDCIRVTGEP